MTATRARSGPFAPLRAAVLLPLLLVGCDRGATGDWCAPTAAGVEAVPNRGPGAWEEQGVRPRLVEVWRHRPDRPLLYPIGIVAAPDGRVAVLDFGSGRVRGIAPDGTGGDDPVPDGRLRAPVAAAWAPEGGLRVFDAMAAKVVLAARGEVVSEAPVAPELRQAVDMGGITWAGLLPDGTVLLQPLIDPDLDGEDPGLQRTVVLRSRAGGTRADTVVAQEVRTLAPGTTSRLPVPGWPFPVLSTAGGRYALGGVDARYRVLVHDSTGRPVRQVCRDAQGAPLRPDELGQVGDSISSLNLALQRAPKPESPAPFDRLVLGVDGSLWVQRDRRSPIADEIFGRPGATYDVFDAAGRYLGEIRAPENVTFHAAAADTVWGFATERGVTEVVAYRVERG